MYQQRFGLSRRPFASTVDALAYFPAVGHERAFRQIVDALGDNEAVVVLTSDAGLGKTLLVHRLLDQFAGQRTILWLTNAHLADAAAFYQALLYDLGRPFLRRPEQEMRLELTELLVEAFQHGQPGLLAIDEAHHLGIPVLEEIRLLGNLETGAGRVIQIVLVGQPALLVKLRQPELTSLRQRIAVRAVLAPLSVEESIKYLMHLVRAAGARPERLITQEALELLARGAGGIPRRLNQAGHLALQLACLGEQPVVDAEAALEALDELGLNAEGSVDTEATRLPAPQGPHWTEEGTETAGQASPKVRRLFGPTRRTA